MNIAIILSGGIGSRVGDIIPKQYIQIKGKPIIAYTLEKFEEFRQIDAVEVVCKEEYFSYMSDIKDKYKLTKLRWINKSGPTCQISMRNGIFALRNDCQQNDNIIFHMSVSPLVSEVTINNAIALCEKKGNAFAAQPCLFCMCKKDNEEWSEQNAFKEDYVQLNMPWVIKYGEIFDLYTITMSDKIEQDVRSYLPGLLFEHGRKVYFVQDNDNNKLKITTKGDLDLFEAYLMLNETKKRSIE